MTSVVIISIKEEKMLNGNRMKSERGRHPRDFYKTPYSLADKAMWTIRDDEELGYWISVEGLDAGCGDGVWGKASRCLWWASDEGNVDADIDGIDIKPEVESFSEYYSQVWEDDFITHEFHPYTYDIVFGNPPYSLAEEFIKKAFSIVNYGGYVYFLLRLAFLEGIRRGNNFWPAYPLKTLYVCSRRPSFYKTNGRNTTDTLSYGMFLWKKGWQGNPEIKFLDWEYEYEEKS